MIRTKISKIEKKNIVEGINKAQVIYLKKKPIKLILSTIRSNKKNRRQKKTNPPKSRDKKEVITKNPTSIISELILIHLKIKLNEQIIRSDKYSRDSEHKSAYKTQLYFSVIIKMKMGII